MGDRGAALVYPPIHLTAGLAGVVVVYLLALEAGVPPRVFWGWDFCPDPAVTCGSFPLGPILGAVAGVCVLGLAVWGVERLRERESA